MSFVTYNDVILPYSFHTAFAQEVVYEDSMTDWYITNYDITIQSIINNNYLAALAPALIGVTTNPADIMSYVRGSLMKPRRTLSIKVNGVELIPQKQNQGQLLGKVDAQSGPKPQYCVITQLTNTTFLITYRIVAQYWENARLAVGASPLVKNRTGNNVLYNRWTETQDIDNLNYTTRMREGKFVIRSDNVDGFIADQLRRNMAVVGIPDGCLRKSSRYKVSPDGLAIEYQVVDQEVFKKPPTPAYWASGQYSETMALQGGYRRFGNCTVTLRGAKNTNQSQLIDRAIAVAVAKVSMVRVGQQLALVNAGQNRGILHQFCVRTNMYERNEVEVNIQVSFGLTGPVGAAGVPVLMGVAGINGQDRLATTPFTDGAPAYTPNYPLRGTVGAGNFTLQAAAYYDPSLVNTIVNPITGQLSAGLVPGQAGRIPEA